MNKIKKLASIATTMALTAIPMLASATTPYTTDELMGSTSGTGVDNTGLLNVKLGTQKLPATIAQIINAALGLLGVVAVVIILIGGFMWMTAGGGEEKTKKARDLIVAGIIGLAIVLSAFAIATFVVGKLRDATT